MRPRVLLSPLLLVPALFACGAPGTPGGSKTPAPTSSAASEAPSAPKADPGTKPAEASGPARPSCADGSCFECGEGVCPAGFFCQKSAGVAGCAWATECPQKPTCACVAPLAPGCTCAERGGFPHVTCGS
ncbi:MAG: hypothetical protein MUF64_18935 [Polyangiaceae bacterium]|nr:hypothetical protein [Polyangiaceae bacterium]